VKKAVFGILGSFVLLCAVPTSPQETPQASGRETPAALVARLETDLQKRDLAAYLGAFDEAGREAEQGRINSFFDDLKMTGVVLRLAGVQNAADGVTYAFIQAFFENDYSAVLQSWMLTLTARGGGWSVAGLRVTGALTRLYKLRIPSDRAVRARKVEVQDVDIRFTFGDAAVFFDNLPNVETGLVIVGRGRVEFTPGSANEKHQLDLLYKRDRLEAEVDSLYIRASQGFFSRNVVVAPEDGGRAVSAAERAKAAEVFARNYPRSFTIESSIDGGLLSFLPQGDETVLEFKGRKTGEMVYIYYPYSEEEISLYDHGKERTVCLYSPEEPDEGAPLKRMTLSFSEKFDISSYGLDLGFTPSSSRLSAKAHIEIVPNVDLLESFRFRFNTDLEILKITDAAGRELFYTTDKARKLLYVYLLDPASAGVTTSIDVYYRGRMQPAAATTDVVGQAGLNERIRLHPRYETAFYTHAGYWYPGPVDEDYFTTRLTITTPPEYQCVANGELVESGHREEMDDVAALEHAGNAVYTFISRAPVKYMSFIVGKFGQKRERPGPVPVTSVVSSEVMNSKPGLVDEAADILDFYAGSFGPFPYEKLGIVTRLWPVLGGHSPASFIVVNEVPWQEPGGGFRAPSDTPVDLSAWDEYFLAHEIAHQWWGQGVSFGSYRDQWLSEGLAQYAAASYLRHRYGEGAYVAILKKFTRWTQKKSFRGPVVMGSRLSYFDYAAYQAIVYDKAAETLFMLRDLIGPAAFDAGLRSFFERYKFRAARTGEFVAAMEAAAGRGLGEFFRGWLYDWELPDVRTTWTAAGVPGGGTRVELRVTQVKGRFVFPLWVEWTCKGRSGRALLIVDEPVKTFTLDLPGKLDRLRVNPDRAVPGKFS
jgi:hypothetical protein